MGHRREPSIAGSMNCQYELLKFIMPLYRIPNSGSELVRLLKEGHASSSLRETLLSFALPHRMLLHQWQMKPETEGKVMIIVMILI